LEKPEKAENRRLRRQPFLTLVGSSGRPADLSELPSSGTGRRKAGRRLAHPALRVRIGQRFHWRAAEPGRGHTLCFGRACPRRHTVPDLVFFALDPVSGQGGEVGRMPWTENLLLDWDVSPDGKTVAMALHDQESRAFAWCTYHPEQCRASTICLCLMPAFCKVCRGPQTLDGSMSQPRLTSASRCSM
jgi:hypothetical protein